MRIATIHKPYFLPWMGYFAKLINAQVFVVQDNVLTSTRVWVNRTQIIRPDGQPQYLTVPIGQRHEDRISEIQVSVETRSNCARRIQKSIEHAYARSRCFGQWERLRDPFLCILDEQASLARIDLALIKLIMDNLALPLPMLIFASELPSGRDDIDNLILCCQSADCDTLLVGKGSKVWSSDDMRRLNDANITLLCQDFLGEHPNYYQTRRQQLGFLPGLSIIDCLLNEGPSLTADLLHSVPLRAFVTEILYE